MRNRKTALWAVLALIGGGCLRAEHCGRPAECSTDAKSENG